MEKVKWALDFNWIVWSFSHIEIQMYYHLLRALRICLTYHFTTQLDSKKTGKSLRHVDIMGDPFKFCLYIRNYAFYTTESNTSASYLILLLSIGRDGQLRSFLYKKCDDFNFHIKIFPFMCSNIPYSPAYSVFISQLIRYTALTPPKNILSWRHCDCGILCSLIRFSDRDVWNRLLWRFLVDTGILSSNMKPLSQECYIWHSGILGDNHM